MTSTSFGKRLASGLIGGPAWSLSGPSVFGRDEHHQTARSYRVLQMTQTITLFQQSSVIWLIGAEVQEKRPVRRQYITALTTGTIKLLCHLLFLAWKQGPFIPRRLNVHLCSRRGSWASNVRVEPQTLAGEAITELLLISALRRRHHRHIVKFWESFYFFFTFCVLRCGRSDLVSTRRQWAPSEEVQKPGPTI